MKMKKIYLKFAYTDADIAPLVENNVQPSAKDYDRIIEGYCTVYKPNGEVLFKLLPGAIAYDYAVTAFDAFHDQLTDVKNSNRAAMLNSENPGSEGVVGFMDPVHRIQFCRPTALTIQHLEEYKETLPFIRAAAELMKVHMPDRYAAQKAACDEGHADYIIPSTPFSTVTINRDVTATYHTDQGDYKAGIGVIAVTWATKMDKAWRVVTEAGVEGGLLVFPKFRIAVRVRTQDLLLCDVHEVHGVTPVVGVAGEWARLSFVFYLREKIIQCPSMAEEIARINAKDTPKQQTADEDEEAE